MTTKLEDATHMGLVERRIAELEARLATLKNVIAALNVEGEDTHNQAELFANMSRTMIAVQRYREVVFAHKGTDGNESPDKQ